MSVELGTVRHRSAVLTVLLDCTLEALTLGNSRRIDLIARCEDVCLDDVLHIVLGSILEAELSEETSCGEDLSLVLAARHNFLLNACLLELTRIRLVDKLRANLSVRDLNRVVAVALLALHASHDAGACLKHRNRHQHTGLVVDLGHTDLCCKNCLFHFFLLFILQRSAEALILEQDIILSSCGYQCERPPAFRDETVHRRSCPSARERR